jgi:hypothetical protein
MLLLGRLSALLSALAQAAADADGTCKEAPSWLWEHLALVPAALAVRPRPRSNSQVKAAVAAAQQQQQQQQRELRINGQSLLCPPGHQAVLLENVHQLTSGLLLFSGTALDAAQEAWFFDGTGSSAGASITWTSAAADVLSLAPGLRASRAQEAGLAPADKSVATLVAVARVAWGAAGPAGAGPAGEGPAGEGDSRGALPWVHLSTGLVAAGAGEAGLAMPQCWPLTTTPPGVQEASGRVHDLLATDDRLLMSVHEVGVEGFLRSSPRDGPAVYHRQL